MNEPIIVFVPTGEVRSPRKDEWYLDPTLAQFNDNVNLIFRANHDWGVGAKLPMFTRHEIPVPKGATDFNWMLAPWPDSQLSGWCPGQWQGTILLSRPRRMVKKHVEGWMNVYPERQELTSTHFQGGTIYPTKENAISHQEMGNLVATIAISGDYEVEE